MSIKYWWKDTDWGIKENTPRATLSIWDPTQTSALIIEGLTPLSINLGLYEP